MTIADPGIISSGTLRTADLLQILSDTLEFYDDDNNYADEISEARSYIKDGELIYEDTEPAGYALEALWVALDDSAPEGYYFGTNESDPTVIGFFPVEDWDE